MKLKFFLSLLVLLTLTACGGIENYVSPLVRAGHQIDLITVDKSDRIMTIWERGRAIKHYRIMALGLNPVGHKTQEGDEKTPEGSYTIDRKHKSNKYQYFLHISYPNEMDKAQARARGVSPGGHVGIHGFEDGWKGIKRRNYYDWTDGCIAVDSYESKELFDLIKPGTRIEIRG
jgi:murein L,D-transpeptidase YafK